MLKYKNAPALFLLLSFFCLWQTTAPAARADTVADPVGNTFGTGLVQHEITGVSATFNTSSLTFTVDFAGAVFAPSANNERSVFGFIDIDSDRNPATGAAPWVNVLGPTGAPAVSLGDEYWLDLFSEEVQPGRVDVVNQMSEVVGTAPITYGTNLLSVTVPLSLLGNSNGLVNYGLISGTFAEATDRAPNGSVPLTSTAVPEPASCSIVLLALGLLAFGTRRPLLLGPKIGIRKFGALCFHKQQSLLTAIGRCAFPSDDPKGKPFTK
jgi:PEP-CTERM motif-containing protein